MDKYLLADIRHLSVVDCYQFYAGERSCLRDCRNHSTYTGPILSLPRIDVVLAEVVMRRYKSEQRHNNFSSLFGLHLYDSNAFG